jgi:hypothetical protein
VPDQKPENTETDVKALIAAMQAQLAKMAADMTSGFTGQRSMYDKQLGELRTKLDRVSKGDVAYNKPYNRDADNGAADNQNEDDLRLAETDRFERSKDRFERRHPQYATNPELKKRVDAILNDQTQRAALLTRDDSGRVNYDRVYRDAYLEARDQIATEAEAHSATAKAQAEEEKRKAKTDAILSGDSIEELPEGISLESIEAMSADDMVKKGLVPGVRAHKPVVGV